MTEFDLELRAHIPRVLVEVVPGEPLSATVPIRDHEGADVPVSDADQWTAIAQVRADWSSDQVLHTFTSDGDAPNASVVEGPAGAVVLTATAAQTAAWQAAWTFTPPAVPADLFVVGPGLVLCVADLVLQLLPRTTRFEIAPPAPGFGRAPFGTSPFGA